jgi:tRNA A-37 threonylcarbamoyl transferase component Bud32/tetratricopeptide (TPR) repeat protein
MSERKCPSPESLGKFLDEKLNQEDFSAVSRHLETCTACQTACDQLTKADHAPSRGDVVRRSHPSLGKLIRKMVDSRSLAAARQKHERTNKTSSEFSSIFPGAPDPRAPLGRIGHYAVVAAIAEGNQGALFRAVDESLNRVVAIKIVHKRLMQSSSSAERFRREARLLAAVHSEFVVRVFQSGQQDGFPPYLVMEFVEGESLRSRLDRERLIPFRQSAEIVRDISRGLLAAHQAGLVHRDVKPSNILLDQRTGHARLTDFGLAVEETDAVQMTQDGVILGTPAYMSPEQVHRTGANDTRSDLYSLGVVLYELLTGEVPFRGTVRATLLQLVHEEPVPPRRYNESIPKDLETICLRAMAKDRSSRFQTAQDLIDELERWLDGRPVLSRPTGRLERVWRWCRRNPMVSSLSALVLVLLITLSVVMAWSSMRLLASSQESRNHALAAQRQSSALLETLGRLVFELQEKFDGEHLDINELQKESLQIALDGLRDVRNTASSTASPDLHSAEALRRLGDLLRRLEDDQEALACLEQSEAILRDLLKREPNNSVLLKRLVEVLWSRDEIATLSDVVVGRGIETPRSPSGSSLKEAAELARRRLALENSSEARFMLAISLMKSGYELIGTNQLVEAESVFVESANLLTPELTGTSKESDEARLAWLEANDLLYLAIADQSSEDSMDRAADVLKASIQRCDQFLTLDQDNPLLLVFRLEAQDRLISHESLDQPLDQNDRRPSTDGSSEATTAVQKFQSIVQSLISLTSNNSDRFFDTALALSEVIEARLDDEDDPGAERFLLAVIQISEARLLISQDDPDAHGQLAESWSDLGELKRDMGQSQSDVLDCYRRSVTEYRQINDPSWFVVSDWVDFVETQLDVAELAKGLPSDSTAASTEELVKQIREALSNAEQQKTQFDDEWLEAVNRRITALNTNQSPDAPSQAETLR